MKVSKQKKEETRRKLIKAAVHLMITRGYDASSMREIAREAGVGDATIYNYFPTKETIVWAYIRHLHETVIKKLPTIPDFKDYTLQEKLQTYYEGILEQLLPDREFVPIAIKQTRLSFLTHEKEARAIMELAKDQLRTFLKEAIESGEIPDQSVDSLYPQILFDIYMMVLLYWNQDKSENFTATTELIDLILNIVVGVLKQQLIAKVFALGSFLLRHHLFGQLQSVLGDEKWRDLEGTWEGVKNG